MNQGDDTVHQPAGDVLLQLRWVVSDQQDHEFNRWYDEEHLADMLAVDGMLSGRRFRRAEVPFSAPSAFNNLTLYEVDDLGAFTKPEYLALGTDPSEWTRRVAFDLELSRTVYARIDATGAVSNGNSEKQPVGRALLHVMTEVEPHAAADFHSWYTEEHIPMLLTAPGVLAARRFTTADGEPAQPEGFRFLAVYELADVGVATSPEFAKAGAPTPRRARSATRCARRPRCGSRSGRSPAERGPHYLPKRHVLK